MRALNERGWEKFAILSRYRIGRDRWRPLVSTAKTLYIQGGPKKLHKVYGTIILQPYIIESCGFQQNVPKEILHMTKVSV